MESLTEKTREKIDKCPSTLAANGLRILEESGLAKLLRENSDKYIPFINSRARLLPDEDGELTIMNALTYCAYEMPSLTEPLDPHIDLAIDMMPGSESYQEKFHEVIYLMSRYLIQLYLSRE